MTINAANKTASNKLKRISSTPDLDAEILLAFILNISKEKLLARGRQKLSTTQLLRYKKLLGQRLKGMPVAYLIGRKEFFGRDFIVNRHVLIPRPDTETLVEKILSNNKIKSLADIGTGSGVIAITLALKNPNWKIYASDISEQALRVAKLNASKYKQQKKIQFLKSDLLSSYHNIYSDAIVANLPYLDKKDAIISPDTIGLKFEPAQALYADHHGLQHYIRLFKQISELANPPKFIYLEINPLKKKEIENLSKKYLDRYFYQTFKDLSQQNRFVLLSLDNSSYKVY